MKKSLLVVSHSSSSSSRHGGGRFVYHIYDVLKIYRVCVCTYVVVVVCECMWRSKKRRVSKKKKVTCMINVIRMNSVLSYKV